MSFSVSPRIDGTSLERVLTEIDNGRHVRFDFFARPAIGLLDELELEIVDPNRAEVRAAEVEDLVAVRWALTRVIRSI